jgi:hypothetical protein
MPGISHHRYGRQVLRGKQGNSIAVDRERGYSSLQTSRWSEPDTSRRFLCLCDKAQHTNRKYTPRELST